MPGPMTQLLVNQAQKAIVTSLGAHEGDGPQGKVATLRGKKYTHWSMYVTLAGAVVGAVVAVAGFIFANYALGTMMLIMSAANAIGTYFLREFIPLKSLEGYVKVLTTRVNELSEHIQGLKEVNVELDKLQGDAKKLLVRYKAAAERAENRLETKIQELNRANDKITKTVKDLEAIKVLYEQAEQLTSNMHDEVSRFNEERLDFKGDVEKLRKEVEATNDIEEQINGRTKELAGLSEEFAEKNKKLVGMAKDLRGQIKLLQGVHEELVKEREKLEKQVGELNKAQENALKEAEELRRAAEALENVNGVVEGKTTELKEMNDKLEGAAALKQLLERLAEQQRDAANNAA